MIHKLKIGDEYLDNLLSGKKKVEIRFNDRDYQTGDVLQFYRWDTGMVEFDVTHIHSGLGMANGYVALSVEEVRQKGQDDDNGKRL